MQLSADTSFTDGNALPGRTSLIRTGRGLMTLQTELVGEPAQLRTIIDFRGRVLKRWESACEPVDASEPLCEVMRRWHEGIEVRVRENLAKVAERRPAPSDPAAGHVVARLFLAAINAYRERDFDTARSILLCCRSLAPEARRVHAALERIEGGSQPLLRAAAG